MPINDREAIALRDWAMQEQEAPSPDPFAQEALGNAWGDLLEYEQSVRNEGRVPYELNPAVERGTLERVRKLWKGEELVSPETTKDMSRQSAEIAYLSMRFQKPVEDIQNALPSYKQALTQMYPEKDYESALEEDMESMTERLDMTDKAYRHAYMSAFAGQQELDGFMDFSEGVEEIPDGITNLYTAAYTEARQALDENRQQFESLASAIKPIVQNADLRDTRQLFEAVGQLTQIDPEKRTLAMRYIEATVPGEKGVAESFFGRLNELTREFATMTPGQIHRNALGIIEAVKAGQPIQEPVAFTDQEPFESPAASAAFRVTYTEPGQRLPFYHKLTPEETASRYADAKTAAEFAEAMLWMQRYSREVTGPESFAENPSLKAAYEQVVYGGSRMTADMAMVLGSVAVGRKVGGMRGQEQFKKIVGMGYGLKSMIPALQSEHYDMLRASGLDAQDAMFVSDASAPIAATLEVMGDLFVLSKLPGVKGIQKRLGATITSPALAAAVSTGEALGVETATEIAQDMTASIVQAFASALDEDIPEATLAEDLKDTLKSAPDIALNVLPFALIGGGHSAYVTTEARQSLVANRDAMEFFGLPEEAVSEIMEAGTLREKEAIFRKNFDLKKALKSAIEAQEAGVEIADLANEDGTAAVEAAEANEGNVSAIKSEDGEIEGYEVQGMPEQKPTRVRTRQEMSNLTPEPQETSANAKSPTETNPVRGKVLGMENVEESPLRTNMPNPANVTFATVEQTKKGKPVSAPQAMQAIAEIMKAVGEPAIIRQGRFGRRKALGTYWVKQKLARVATANDVTTAAHEIAHALEDALYGTGPVWQESKEIDQSTKNELLKLGKDLYGNKPPPGGFASEGFAEFIRLRLSDPEQAAQKAPKFNAHWEGQLKKFPNLQKQFNRAQEVLTRYLKQGASRRAEANIAKPETLWQKASAKKKTAARDFYKAWIEAGAAIERFSKDAAQRRGLEALPEDVDPVYTMLSRRMTADSTVDYMATKGMLDFAGNLTGVAPLTDAFNLVGEKKSQDFVIYLWAKRALALWTDPRQRNPGMDIRDAQFLVNELGSTEFEKAAQIVYDWNNGVLEYAAQASEDFAETVDKIRQSDPGFYIPLYREFSTLDQAYSSMGGKAAQASLTKRLKGSGRRIKDPVESMLTQAKGIVLKTHQRVIMEQILRIANSTPGMGHYVFEVPRDMLPSGAQQLDEILRNVGQKIGGELGQQFKAVAQEMPSEIGEEIMSFFAPAYQPKQNENPVMPVHIDGKTRWYEMDLELYKALNGMDLYRLPKVLDLFFGVPARTMRIGTTGLRASFSLVTNPLRDLRTLQLNTRTHANHAQLFQSWLGSLYDVFIYTVTHGKRGTQWIDMFERLGVEMAQPLGQDTRPLKRAAKRVKRSGKWSPFEIGDYYDTLLKVLQFPESASRLAELKLYAKELGYDGKQPLTADLAQKLAIAAKQVTTDFTQAGVYARVVNQAVPFHNAAIQGPVAHVKALRRDPVKFFVRGLYGTGFALAIWYENKDEEWWKEMSTDERYIYTYIPFGDELIRIPRAFEADGLFMAGAEAMADAWYAEDPEGLTEWFGKWLGGFTQFDLVSGVPVPPMPVLPKLAAEQLANRNFFFDSPIVPRGEIMGNVPAEEQFGAYTLNTSIFLGDLFNISPRRIDHSIRSLFGSVGADILSTFGRGNGVKQDNEWEPADIPVFGTLFQRGGQMARNPVSIEKLYEQYGQALERQASEKMEETPEQRQKRLALMDAVRSLSVLRRVQHATVDREKRQKIEEYQIELAKHATSENPDRSKFKQARQWAEMEMRDAEDNK